MWVSRPSARRGPGWRISALRGDVMGNSVFVSGRCGAGEVSFVLIDVRYPVLVVVALLFLPQLAVVPIADPEQDRGQHRGEHGPGQHRDLHVVVRLRTVPKRELADQQRHRETDATEDRDTRD